MIPAELVVRDFLAGRYPSYRVVTEMPKNLADVVPLVHVVRFGGFNKRPGFDTAVMDVDAFCLATSGIADPRNDVRLISEDIRDALLTQLPGFLAHGGTVTGVVNVGAPIFKPYDNTNLRRFGGTYTVYVKPSP